MESIQLTVDLRTLSQAVAFCGAKFGMRKSIDIIRGKVPDGIRDPSKMGFFGKGKDHTVKYWDAVMQLAKNCGLVSTQVIQIQGGGGKRFSYEAVSLSADGHRLCTDESLVLPPISIPQQVRTNGGFFHH